MLEDFAVSPHDVCDKCNGESGPRFSLHRLKGISSAHRNNVIPTGTDLQSRLDDIRDAQLDIDSLDVEISRLKRTLQTLEQRRSDLNNFKYQEMSLFAPIRLLPDDILGKIFVTCQQILEPKPGYIHYSNRNTFVRTATQVSSYWRNAALSMPVLWSHISFSRSHWRSDKMKYISPGDFLEKCLILSGSVPITIEFSDDGPSFYDFSDHSLMELARAANRWENITMKGRYAGIDLNFIMKYIPERTTFSSLKKLGPLKSPENTHTLPPTPALTHLIICRGSISLTSAPLLTHVDISSYGKQLPQDVLTGITWSQVTTYHSDNNFFDDSFHIFLNSMPHLHSLTLNLYMTIELSTFTTIPSLETLSLLINGGLGGPLSTAPLKFLITPKLKELNLQGSVGFEEISALIPKFLERSECNIETLTLPVNAILHGQWNGAQMEHVKDLHVLDIWTPYDGHCTRLMKFLTWKNSSKVFPELKSISFEFSGHSYNRDTKFPVEKFKELVLSRITNVQSWVLTFGNLGKRCGDALENFRASDIVRQAQVDMAFKFK